MFLVAVVGDEHRVGLGRFFRLLVKLDAVEKQPREVGLTEQVPVEFAEPVFVETALVEDRGLDSGRNVLALRDGLEAHDGLAVAPGGLFVVFGSVLKQNVNLNFQLRLLVKLRKDF